MALVYSPLQAVLKNSQPSPDEPVPKPTVTDSTDRVLAHMQDAIFSPTELVHVLAAHTVAAQYGVDTITRMLLYVPFYLYILSLFIIHANIRMIACREARLILLRARSTPNSSLSRFSRVLLL